MENPFELINTRLDKIESLLNEILNKHPELIIPVQNAVKETMDIKEAAEYLFLAPQTLYGYTSKRIIPFYKTSKRIVFKKSDLDEYLFSHRYKSSKELLEQAELRFDSVRRRKKY